MNEFLTRFRFLLRSLVRRRGQALTVAWLVCLTSWGIVVVLPITYESSARIYVDTANILRPLLKGLAVESDVDTEVQLMQRTLISRPNLVKLARMTDLDITATSPLEMELLLSRIESRTRLKTIGPNLFAISYEDREPEKAQEVVQALLTIFVESNLGQSRKDMDTARHFIEDQIEVYERQLEDSERRLAVFKQANLDLLTGLAGYTQQLEESQKQLSEAQALLHGAELRRDILRRELADVPRLFTFNATTDTSSGPATDTVLRIFELEKTLDDLLVRYTENHPDVMATKRRLEVLRSRQEKELQLRQPPGNGPAPPADQPGDYGVSNPVYEQLSVQLVETEANIATLKDRVELAQASLDKIMSSANRVPVVEAELTKLNRDYDVLKNKYEEFLIRREAEKVSRAREIEAENVQFRVIEPPQVPVISSGPHRILLLSLALVIGLASGAAFAILRTYSTDSVYDVKQLKDAMALPVLGVISTWQSLRIRPLRLLTTSVFYVTSLGLLVTYSGLMFLEIEFGLQALLPRSLQADIEIDRILSILTQV